MMYFVTRFRAAKMLLMIVVLSGCSLGAIQEQLEAVDGVTRIVGEVKGSENFSGTLNVLLLDISPVGDASVVSQRTMGGDGTFAFYAPSGRYLVAAYVATGDDGVYKPEDYATYFGFQEGTPELFDVAGQKLVELGTLALIPELAAPHEDTPDDAGLPLMFGNIGAIADLSDPIFSDEVAAIGLWRPVDYSTQFGGGLYLLEPYDPGKIPVVFVHGILGSAASWSEVVEAIDRSRYQPILLSYASGARLDMISDYLLGAISELQARYGFKSFHLIAHSMGGLVARSFALKYLKNDEQADIGLFMTINSPLGGMPVARFGTSYSPVVVPAWRDLVPSSAFLQRIRSGVLGDKLNCHLVFSFVPGESGDGVVPLDSQLPEDMQSDADAIRGFSAEHSGLLSDERFFNYLRQALQDEDAPRRDVLR